jgi:hypothetical protein
VNQFDEDLTDLLLEVHPRAVIEGQPLRISPLAPRAKKAQRMVFFRGVQRLRMALNPMIVSQGQRHQESRMAFSTKPLALLTLARAELRQAAAAPLLSPEERSRSAEFNRSVAWRKRPSQPSLRSMGG